VKADCTAERCFS